MPEIPRMLINSVASAEHFVNNFTVWQPEIQLTSTKVYWLSPALDSLSRRLDLFPLVDRPRSFNSFFSSAICNEKSHINASMSWLLHFGKLIVLTSNFYFYAALIYILCYNSGVAGQGSRSRCLRPPRAVNIKSCLNRANPMRIFMGVKVEVFSDQPLCYPLLSCNWYSLSVLSSASGGFALTPTGALPLDPTGDFLPRPGPPRTFKPAYSTVLLYLL